MKDMRDMWYEASYDIYYEAAYAGGCGGADMSNSKIKDSDNSKKKIIITNDGKVTKAKYFDNEKLMCTGVATCHEDDMFDVFKGAELALDRCKAKKTINDQYGGYRTAHSNIEKFIEGDLAVECRLNQVVGFLDWCEGRGIDISRERNSKSYESFMKYNYIAFYMDDDEFCWVGYNKPGDGNLRYITYKMRVISFDDFFKLPEGVSFE